MILSKAFKSLTFHFDIFIEEETKSLKSGFTKHISSIKSISMSSFLFAFFKIEEFSKLNKSKCIKPIFEYAASQSLFSKSSFVLSLSKEEQTK